MRDGLWTRPVLAGVVLLMTSIAPAQAQSRAASETASGLIAEGSVIVVSGAAEILSGAAELVVVSVETSVDGVLLVLRPVGDVASQAAEVSAAVTVEVSRAAWDAAVSAAVASGRVARGSTIVAGDVLSTVALTGSVATSTAAASVLGTALVFGEVVVGVLSGEHLASLLDHGVHDCVTHAHSDS